MLYARALYAAVFVHEETDYYPSAYFVVGYLLRHNKHRVQETKHSRFASFELRRCNVRRLQQSGLVYHRIVFDIIYVVCLVVEVHIFGIDRVAWVLRIYFCRR